MSASKVEVRAAARVGEVVSGKYRVDELLGMGGMAAVYAATEHDGRRVALKVLHAEISGVEGIHARFLQEGYVANAVGHPGVVRALDRGVDASGCAYLVMELLVGQTLEVRRRAIGGKLAIAEAVAHAVRVLDVLDAAHRQGIVHRDIKPDNVFLLRDGSLKLMDFGIARLVDGSNKTRSGTRMGTPAFMPPEQASGRTRLIDAQSDVWAVGALLFVLLTNEDVHLARTTQEQMIFAATQPARPLASAARHVPPELAHVVDVALAFDQAGRWASAAAMQRALLTAAAHAGIAAPPELADAPLSAPKQAPARPSDAPTLLRGSGGDEPDDD